MFCPLAWLRSAALHIVWITKDLRHTKHLTLWLSVVSLALTLTLTLTLTHSNEYNSSLETRNYVSRHNNDRGTLNASYCIFLLPKCAHSWFETRFRGNTNIEWGMVHLSSVLPYSTQCRPAIHVPKAYSKCQIIWPYTTTMVLILPHTQMIQNALL